MPLCSIALLQAQPNYEQGQLEEISLQYPGDRKIEIVLNVLLMLVNRTL